MAIAAQRFNFLDRETNIATKDFTSLVDNSVYNTLDHSVDTALSNIQNSEGMLNALQGSMEDLSNMLDSQGIMDSLSDALNSAMDAIGNLDLPDIVKDIFNSLKNLDFQGLKDFFKDLLHVGSTILCNNLDFLKLFIWITYSIIIKLVR